jgi:Flp pilus assembly CpaF family ATPase
MATETIACDNMTLFKNLIREQLSIFMKQGNTHFTEIKGRALNYIKSLGYDISPDQFNDLEHWLVDILDLQFIKNVILDFDDNDIEEVIIHNQSWIQIFGQKRKEFFGEFLDKADYQLALEIFVYREKILWNERLPFQSFQTSLFGDDWRATIIHPNLGPSNTAKLFLRCQRRQSFSLENFRISHGQSEFIRKMIEKKKNIIVCGATGSGKTSFLQTLLELVPKRSHITILEDTHEIHLSSPFVTKLLAQEKEGFTLKDFCHYALRLRPERIVLGEIRSHEVVPFLLSLNTGHGGMMASVHSNSALDALQRLCLLFQIYSGETGIQYQEILKLLCTGIDLIVHIENKQVVDILEIRGSEGMTPFYQSWN